MESVDAFPLGGVHLGDRPDYSFRIKRFGKQRGEDGGATSCRRPYVMMTLPACFGGHIGQSASEP
jgi:hypothetical protein